VVPIFHEILKLAPWGILPGWEPLVYGSQAGSYGTGKV